MTDEIDEWNRKMDRVLKLVALSVIKIAKQTGTSVVIWQDGQVKHVPPEEFDTLAWQVEPPTNSPQ